MADFGQIVVHWFVVTLFPTGYPAPFRMAAFDLDGTLLGSNSQVSGASIAVLRRVAARGVHLVAATGRSHFTAGNRLAVTQAVEWAVCSNGATLYHVPSNKVIDQWPIGAEDLAVTMKTLLETFPDLVFGWEAPGRYQWTESFESLNQNFAAPREVVADDAPLPANVLTLFVAHPELIRYDLLEAVAPLTNGVTVSTSGTAFVEITASGVSKAAGLARLALRLGVDPDETIAFGDNLNDLDMLAWAGRGYAMANAHHQVMAQATHRTRLPCTQDGVADVLAEVFLG